MLDKIKDFADKAHGEQMRKYTPDRYIVHPERVMNICKEYTTDETMLAAALLHDVLEDTPVTADEVKEFLTPLMGKEKAERTLEMVIDLTDVFVSNDFPDMNRDSRKERERERMSDIRADSQTIKYADILDNCKEIVKHDRHFSKVFLNECMSLLKVMTKGNPELHERTINELNQSIQQLKQK